MLKVYKLNEIKDSKLQYDKKSPRFMKYISLGVLLLIIGFLVFSIKSVETYVVKGDEVELDEQIGMKKSKTEAQKEPITSSTNEYILDAFNNGKIHLNTKIKNGERVNLIDGVIVAGYGIITIGSEGGEYVYNNGGYRDGDMMTKFKRYGYLFGGYVLGSLFNIGLDNGWVTASN
ncbi:hypothetical protein [Clostridium vincentii]|uniref:Uncharacterized protein n=1 Tax=Clostridium vincentii TaxID=52704 RepID=A0A2T0B8T7_9CLOT|nr:hypothetical protein [Clostridium vincentii]PRR80306.1 hypothetical protein CLVI_30960 [Clostridium vincentii]